MKARITLWLGVVAIAALSGCATVNMAPADADAQAKQFAVATDKANVYIYRNESFGGAVKMPVLIDNMAVGDTGPKTFILRALPPGKHVIVSKAESDSTLTLDLAAGRNYFIWQEVKMGLFSARSLLQQVDDAKGRAGVAECKLVQ